MSCRQSLAQNFSATKPTADQFISWSDWAKQERQHDHDSVNGQWYTLLQRRDPLRLLLADPPLVVDRLETNYPNLGILYLIGYAQKHIKNLVVHYVPAKKDLSEFSAELEKFCPHVVGFSFTTMGARNAYITIGALRERYPSITVICGGAHPTIMPAEVLIESPTDFCVLGEGELTLSELILSFKGIRILQEVSGLAWRQNGVVKYSATRPPVSNLDRLPYPAWERIDPKKFLGPPVKRRAPSTAILTSRGCPYHCVFCSNPVWKLHKPYYRARSPENIAEEINLLYEKGYREIYIRSDEFNADVEWAIAVCKAIKKLDLKDMFFQCNLRADRMTDHLADLLAEIGCWLVHVGIESANDRVLQGIQKQISVSQVESLCTILKKRKIRVFGFFMMGQVWEQNGRLMYETRTEVRNSLRFAWRMARRGLIDYMSWQVATPIPGADLYEVALKHGLIKRSTKPKNMWEPLMDLDTLNNRDIKRLRLEGMLLQSFLYVRSGRIQWRHWRKLFDKILYIWQSIR